MEHTKDDLKVTPIKTIAFTVTGKQFAVLTKGGLSEKELQDRAIHFVKCWNSHDDLLAAVNAGLAPNVIQEYERWAATMMAKPNLAVYHNQFKNLLEILRTLLKQSEKSLQAIAKAKGR